MFVFSSLLHQSVFLCFLCRNAVKLKRFIIYICRQKYFAFLSFLKLNKNFYLRFSPIKFLEFIAIELIFIFLAKFQLIVLINDFKIQIV